MTHFTKRIISNRKTVQTHYPPSISLSKHDSSPTQVPPRAGWSLGDVKFGDTWTVSGTNGKNVILAHGSTIGEAWRRAAEQARSFGFHLPSSFEPHPN
jgi:hypothetical protein